MTTKYIAPGYSKTAFNCMHCGAYSSQFWSLIETSNYGTAALPLSIPRYSARIPDSYVVCWCKHCQNLSFWHEEVLIYPNTGDVEAPNSDLPDEVRRDYLEAADIVTRSPRGAAALLRLAIQKLCDKLVPENGDLNFKIGKLVENGLNSKIQQALDVVRVIGNNAVHPGQIDLKDKPEVAQQLFILVNMITRQMITEPTDVDSMFDALPDKAKKGVKERDKKTQ